MTGPDIEPDSESRLRYFHSRPQRPRSFLVCARDRELAQTKRIGGSGDENALFRIESCFPKEEEGKGVFQALEPQNVFGGPGRSPKPDCTFLWVAMKVDGAFLGTGISKILLFFNSKNECYCHGVLFFGGRGRLSLQP